MNKEEITVVLIFNSQVYHLFIYLSIYLFIYYLFSEKYFDDQFYFCLYISENTERK
jgi:hypothetical protein